MTTSLATPVFGIAGWKNAGKTTLTVRLIEEFTRRGLTVSSVKHTHHAISFEDEGTDSARHRRAGATEVLVVGPGQWALVHAGEHGHDPSLADVLPRLAPSDLILVEGYKSARIPKIEVRRSAQTERRPLAPGDPHIVAIAADHATDAGPLPVFALDDVAAIADFIASHLGLPSAA